MIYLDSAATSLQKPRAVYQAVQKAMQSAGGYGRSGHRPALYAGELVYACRENARRLFGLQEPEQVVFTMNATHALNQAIHALADAKTRPQSQVMSTTRSFGHWWSAASLIRCSKVGCLTQTVCCKPRGKRWRMARICLSSTMYPTCWFHCSIAELDTMLADAGGPNDFGCFPVSRGA